MTSKKTKTVSKITKKDTIKKDKPKSSIVAAPKTPKMFSAYKIVNMLNIPDFDYFIMKQKYNFDDGALFTIADFKQMYKKAIEGR